MTQRAPQPRKRTIRVLQALLLGGLCSCHSIEPYLERYSASEPQTYVVVTPTGRTALPCVGEFVARKRQAGLTVHTVTFDLAVEPPRRLRVVADALARLEPPAGQLAYVLFLATGDELPLGPWRVAGLEDAIDSDIPLLLGATDPAQALDFERWSRAFRSTFPWIPGRVPFADEALIRAALAPPPRRPSEARPLAFLGAERFALWWDTSIIMSRARRPLERHGIRTRTYAEDWPCDIELGLTDPADIRAQHRQVGLESGPADPDLLFAAHWAQAAPEVVYLNSHGSSFFTTSVGDYLLSCRKLDRLGEAARDGSLRSRPQYPAVVVIAACRAGGADSDLTQRLFRDGWARALVASTEDTSPTPLWPAIWAEIDTADALGSGLNVGLAMRAVRESFFDDGRGSWSYALFGATEAALAKNLLALTLYGDPSAPILRAAPAR